MKTRPIKKLPIVEALHEFLASEEGIELCEGESLDLKSSNQQYLKNRIEKAFLLGWAAKTKEVQKRIRDFVS